MPDTTNAIIALHGISNVAGRYVIGREPMHPGINLFACRLRSISTEMFTVAAPVVPPVGEWVDAHLGPFGSVGGRLARQTSEGFVVTIAHADAGSGGLAGRIARYRDRPWTGPGERRADRRFMPGEPRSIILRPDGWAQPCLVVDYSSSGAAVSTAFAPMVGEVVTVGQITAEVVRHFDVGFAVRFFERQNAEEIETLLQAPEEWRDAVRLSNPGLDTIEDAEADSAYGADG